MLAVITTVEAEIFSVSWYIPIIMLVHYDGFKAAILPACESDFVNADTKYTREKGNLEKEHGLAT